MVADGRCFHSGQCWLLLRSNCIATDLVCPHTRSVALENNRKLGMEVAHFGRSIEALVHNRACWDDRKIYFDNFSQGGWNMNGGDTKLSELNGNNRMQNLSLIF